MIWDSVVWKDELAKDLEAIRHLITDAESGVSFEQTAVAIEKFAFTSAFIVRKLLEAKKLSDEVESTSLSVRRFPRIKAQAPIHFMNWHKFDTFYDLGMGDEERLFPRKLCNLLIHSLVFVPETNETGRITGILFNSDHIKDKCLYRISMDALFTFIELVASDYIVCMDVDHWSEPGEIVVHKSRKKK